MELELDVPDVLALSTELTSRLSVCTSEQRELSFSRSITSTDVTC